MLLFLKLATRVQKRRQNKAHIGLSIIRGDEFYMEKGSSGLVRRLWIGLGTFFVVLGTIGIFLPLLPTTPFLLLAAACYARGSRKFYDWLLNNRWFGDYIRNYREKKGIPLKIKVLSISFLWVTIGYSTLFIIDIPLVRIILILIAIGVSIHIMRFRTLK